MFSIEVISRDALSMAGTVAEARAMADNYLALESTAHPEDRHRYHTMANWWLKRAAELDVAEQSRTPHESNLDT
jgi:hypothetical protein